MVQGESTGNFLSEKVGPNPVQRPPSTSKLRLKKSIFSRLLLRERVIGHISHFEFQITRNVGVIWIRNKGKTFLIWPYKGIETIKEKIVAPRYCPIVRGGGILLIILILLLKPRQKAI